MSQWVLILLRSKLEGISRMLLREPARFCQADACQNGLLRKRGRKGL